MTIRVGIVGTGGISRAHHRSYTTVGGFEIVAVCDIIKSKASALGRSRVNIYENFSPCN